jgi:enoyl-CoA hydratase
MMKGQRMNFNTIIYEKGEGVGIIKLNRPKRMNALCNELLRELNMLIDNIKKDDEISVVIITGDEKFFASGADINELAGVVAPIDAHHIEPSAPYVFNKIEKLEKPVIAAISGPALGGGCELALACDIRIAAENATFGQPEIRVGIVPGAGGTQRLPRLIGLGKAKELLYTGDPIDAQEAYRIGLVNKLVRVESLMEEAKKMALKLVRQPGFALKMIKMAVNHGINMDLQSAMAYEARCFEMAFSTEDQKEGMRAFIEKRKPIFKGR